MKTVVKIKREEFDKINLYLKDGSDLKIHDLEEDATLLCLTGKFENGYECRLEVFTGHESVMSTAYLYDDNGNDITYIECDEGLDTEYEFKIDNDKFTLELEVED